MVRQRQLAQSILQASCTSRCAGPIWSGELIAPKRLVLSPDQSMLVVTDTVSRYSWSFQIAADGTLINGEPFYRLELPETTVMSWQGGPRGA